MKRIPLTQGKFTLVDDQDYEYLNQFKWHSCKGTCTFYASRNVVSRQGKRERTYMHRIILQPPSGKQTDHRNGDGLQNCRSNLRICSSTENNQNRNLKTKGGTSPFKGVDWYKQMNKWRARITLSKRQMHLGYFVSEIEAAKIYDQTARKLFGEFARPNFPNSKEVQDGKFQTSI